MGPNAITIEQNSESGQTYFRLMGVGHGLREPIYRIVRSDSNEMLGPEGWKKEAFANEARQCLDGGDLLLELDARLINYIETGRAIEIRVDELNWSARVVPPPLETFPARRKLPPEVKVYPFERGGVAPDAQAPVSSLEAVPPPLPPAPPPQLPAVTGGSALDIVGEKLAEPPPPATPATPDVTETPPPPPQVRKAGWSTLSVCAALVMGTGLGFAGEYIRRERIKPPPPPISARQLEVLQSEAFAPLNTDIAQLSERSPRGARAADISRINPDRHLALANRGDSELRANPNEAMFWYKQAARYCDRGVLVSLGDAYFSGEGVVKDPNLGFQLLRLAAALGSTKARDYIAELLENGKIAGAPSSFAQAYRNR